MLLHDEEIKVGDGVYDISAKRGYGEVTRILENTFEVSFPRYTLTYTSEGIQVGYGQQTLFWSKPIIIAPMKDSANNAQKRTLIENFLDIVSDYSKLT